MIDSTWKNETGGAVATSSEWRRPLAYRLHILITKDKDGTYSAVVLNLPGVGSCGDTEEEAMENVKEAVHGVLESYKEAGEDIPWKDSSSQKISADQRQVWIIVDV
jgi:predicted RNase H-like HicB family nuclease